VGVNAEAKKVGDRGEWRIEATTDKLAAGRKELRNALAEIVKTARDNGWVDEKKAERWLDKLERGRMLKEGWPKYLVLRKNMASGFAYASAPDGGEADAERLAAVIEALTGKKPKIRRMKNGTIMIVCGREHLDGFTRYAELAGVIEKWLEETRGR
jgi:ParB-like chromosome segregation protein Spo0J